MSLFKLMQQGCKYFPPLFSGYIRELCYPFKRAIKDNITFSRKSITGSIFSGNTSDLHSYWFSIHGFFDWRNIIIKSPDIIEIGANIGTETIGFADIVGKDAFVHAFEPLPSNLKELEKIKQNNKHLNINIYPVALSNHQSTIDFQVPPENYSGIGKIVLNNKNNLNVIKVNVHQLDEYILDFNNVSGIFIDTEGHEFFVLEGAKQTIQKFKPVVVLEVSENLLAEHSKSSKDILRFFETIDYDCYNIGRFLIKQVTWKNLLQCNRHTNWICVPLTSHELIIPIRKKLYKHIFSPLTKI